MLSEQAYLGEEVRARAYTPLFERSVLPLASLFYLQDLLSFIESYGLSENWQRQYDTNTMSIVIAIIPPKKSIEAIRNALRQYSEYMGDVAPENTWHVPLVETSSEPELQSLRQSFHQTARILSISEGDTKGELWVRLQMSPSLTALRNSLLKHVPTDSFTPHMYLGSFVNVPAFGILDTPLADTFSIKELHVIQLNPYEVIRSIPITP